MAQPGYEPAIADLIAGMAGLRAAMEARKDADQLTWEELREVRKKLDQVPSIVADLRAIEQRLATGTQRMQAADDADTKLKTRVGKLEKDLSTLITQIRNSRWLLLAIGSGAIGLATFTNQIWQFFKTLKGG